MKLFAWLLESGRALELLTELRRGKRTGKLLASVFEGWESSGRWHQTERRGNWGGVGPGSCLVRCWRARGR